MYIMKLETSCNATKRSHTILYNLSLKLIKQENCVSSESNNEHNE